MHRYLTSFRSLRNNDFALIFFISAKLIILHDIDRPQLRVLEAGIRTVAREKELTLVIGRSFTRISPASITLIGFSKLLTNWSRGARSNSLWIL